MLELVHRGGAPGIAMEGQISRMMREAGQGGLGPCRRHLWPALSELATGLSLLVRYLKTIGLRIRVGYAEMEGWELACEREQDITGRKEMNSRGIVLRAELKEDGEIPIRVGQCWEMQGRAIEILGFRGNDIEIMEWECGHSVKVNMMMSVKEENRPKGMGGSTLLSSSELTLNASHLLELSVDEVTKGGEGDLICKVIAKRRNKAIERKAKIPRYLTREWASWDGCAFTHIFTDGSYKENATWGEQLLGTVTGQAGGAVILSDGVSWYYKIYVKIDIEVEDAGQVELICLLIANEMAKARGKPVLIVSDCKSALDIVNGTYSERFLNSMAGWEIWEGANTKHIKAHPERHKKWGTWDGEDMGIYVADRVAGGFLGPHRTVSARQWLIRISSQSKVAIELEDGLPPSGV